MPDKPGLEAGHTAASGPPGPPDATVGPDEALNDAHGPQVAPLPHLTGDELMELHIALAERADRLTRTILLAKTAGATRLAATLTEQQATCRSLQTIVSEARYSLNASQARYIPLIAGSIGQVGYHKTPNAAFTEDDPRAIRPTPPQADV